ncbi:hypothetical protein [Deinococcus peraridilitoris]|uniref:Uncharacterized protein n=1 Tax=Deinococcus peraridilitoris (strain DSM 19664 / LMG 22246 / CIP 109416 / KR-200) TaxID=937777 RepID=L0A389_DEIPD|nr:hypothetical protein [Deinococcus peraridilitoris]AFZ68311.1 hypothetical protein Deipe_2848 [Deinococcus peraridilitoris DSM 19664]
MPGLLIALLVLLNVGGIITVIVNLGQGNPRWVTDLIAVGVLDLVGFYLLRIARQ